MHKNSLRHFKMPLYIVAICIGIALIIWGLRTLYPYVILSICGKWPSYLKYLQDIHPQVLSSNLLAALYVVGDIILGPAYIVSGISLLLSYSHKHWKSLIICGGVLLVLCFETYFVCTIVSSQSFSFYYAWFIFAAFVILYGFYCKNSNLVGKTP